MFARSHDAAAGVSALVTPTIFYCAPEGDLELAEMASSAMSTFPAFVERHIPGLEFQVQPLPPALRERLWSVVRGQSLPGAAAGVLDLLGVSGYLSVDRSALVLLALRWHSACASAWRATGPFEVWGRACDSLAVVIDNYDKTVFWHEALHLLGAGDCYDGDHPDTSPGPSCELANCIMQYDMTLTHNRGGPSLCSANCKLIRSQWNQDDQPPSV